MTNFWFMSDPHAYHTNIAYGSSKWEDKEACRDFKDEFVMTETLIKNINENVKHNDILYCLGDWSFGSPDNVWKFRDRLAVQTLHLVLGNHDINIIENRILKTDAGYKNAQSLFTTVNQYVDKKINGQNMFLCHYPMRAWHKASRGSWNLHGHVHGRMPQYKRKDGKLYRSFDVGFDNHPEFRPFHFDEISSLFSNSNYIDFDEDQRKR